MMGFIFRSWTIPSLLLRPVGLQGRNRSAKAGFAVEHWLAELDVLKMLTVKLLVPSMAEWPSHGETFAVTVLLVGCDECPRLAA